ncbi:MAG: tRNA (guanine(10)-N(2))-dimethyltransferase [Candidatus Bathyarchaeota archaeon]|jgi:tRNA (guanine26-N2/guanine27-N2)-dimethyltransferase|nr:tRNA (guanine(10)-N(2))-dimethyltransferase [Candidatus Bathyarchaeota archaeon A05DMB-5]MDH7557989.1 tRNA (guanine(10)-N(2))-dimethyltransferase [Candidatus Bathyarchaeota archaeon]
MKKTNATIDFPTETIQEGKTKITVPKLKAFIKQPSDYAPSKAPVFYNPIMELNRDIAVLALQAYQKIANREISVCEPLTGCGIRGIRFAKEVKGVKKVLINDINDKAAQLAKINVQKNKLDKRITVKNEDANFLLAHYSEPHKRFDAIDIDPFGSPVPYLDPAIRALRNNGLLALTATDMAPLCGVHPKACIRKYGGKPLRTEYCHELAVRLLAGCLATIAAKHDIGMQVIFSHSANHYVRVYATINYSAKKADESIEKMGYILHCSKCFHRETTKGLFKTDQLKCSECGSKMNFAGPLWLGKLADQQFCETMKNEARRKVLKTGGKIAKILNLISKEADAPPTYYVLDKICDKTALPVPSTEKIIETLKEKGFKALATHFNTKGIRTNANASILTKIVEEFFRKI